MTLEGACGQLQPPSGPRVRRRLVEPRLLGPPCRHAPGEHALALQSVFAVAVRAYGSDCGGYLAFNPLTGASAGVWGAGAAFPRLTVVVPLAWGRITPEQAQQLLEADAWFGADGTLTPPGA